jgi:selenocysteine lyase/cysteine desulfurase
MTAVHVAPQVACSLDDLRRQFTEPAGYLSACTGGLPMADTRRVLIDDLDSRPDPDRYTHAVEASRRHFAQLVSAPVDEVAIASQTSVTVALVASSLPENAEVLVPEEEFSSVVLPFVHAGRGISVRSAPLGRLAEAITPQTTVVAFSLVQSATGEVAARDEIRAAASANGALTLCDVTQAAGWYPVDAREFDVTLCHAYKWLCCPRGVAFGVVRPEIATRLRPMHAGWFAGEDPWSSCYGADVELAHSARRFDVSPAWQACRGAEPALRAFADADTDAVYTYTTGLAEAFRDGIGLEQPERPSAIVTWADPAGEALKRLSAAGLTASGRAGRARVAFHVFNTTQDVARTVRAVRG